MNEASDESTPVDIDGVTVELPKPVAEWLRIGDVVVVRLETSSPDPARDNVRAFDPNGEHVWAAEPVKAPSRDENTYVDLREDEGELWASDWKGSDYRLDPETGEVLDETFRK